MICVWLRIVKPWKSNNQVTCAEILNTVYICEFILRHYNLFTLLRRLSFALFLLGFRPTHLSKCG